MEGLYCPAFDAYLDPPLPAPRAILSHAHADHAVASHGEIWATPETTRIYRRRNPEWTGPVQEIGFGDRRDRFGTLLEAFPSGHILGSAQWRFSNADSSLLYTGDFKGRVGRTAIAAQTPQARVLLTESTFGLPVFHFPARETLEARILEVCREAIEQGETPVLLAYALGKAQEAAMILTDAKIPTVLHGAAWKLLPDYEAAGFSFPLSRAYESGPPVAGEALLVPPRCARTPIVQKLKKRRVVYLSGWAVRAASRADFDADVLVPLSDHADFPELLAHVEQVAPDRVVTHHGYARDFARILGGRGIEAQALSEGGERGTEDPD
jgi:DNA ligase 1